MLSATIVEFNKVDPSAAKLLMPYLGWTLFASALNYNIWANNTTKEDGTVKTDGTVKQVGSEFACVCASCSLYGIGAG